MGLREKYLNEKHEVIFETEMIPVKQGKDGDIVEHKKIIRRIKYYEGQGDVKREITLSTQFVKDLAKEIENIESVRKEMEQDEDLPF